MVDRLAIPAEDIIEWDFQVEQQGFITRYGHAGLEFYKQTVLQSGAVPGLHPVKRISSAAYVMSNRFHLADK